jgi:diguanylate cyclase (GGDEF)-like protein
VLTDTTTSRDSRATLSPSTLDRLAPLLDCDSEREGWIHCVEIAQRLFAGDLVATMEFTSPDRAVVRSSVGIKGLTPGMEIPISPDSQAAFVHRSNTPCVSHDLEHDTRFVPSGFFVRVGIRSSMSISLDLPDGHRAIIGVHSTEPSHFGPDDITSFEPLATVFGSAIRRMRRWDELELGARIDPLTSLLNRAAILRHLGERIDAAQPTTVLLIDLDGFKNINDEFGHRVGDSVLRTIAERIDRSLAPGDRLGRIGGDEFLLVTSEADAGVLGQHVISHVEEIIMVDTRSTQISASVGVARWRTGEDALAMIERADRLMYRAKSAGRGRILQDISVSVPSEQRIGPQASTNTITTSLEAVDEAIANLRIVVQPIVDAATHELCGIEALTRGPIGHPLEFPDRLFEAATTRYRLDELELASKTLAFNVDVADHVPLYINLEPALVCDKSFMTKLARAWHLSGSDRPVVAELTERAVLQSPGHLLRAIEACRELGWKIALDDVGSRSESLAALRWIDPDVVKLDLRLIASDNRAHSAHVVAAVTAFRDTPGRRNVVVIAEGVETAEDAQRAEVLGADRLQGFLFGRPASVDDLRLRGADSFGGFAALPVRDGDERVVTKRELLDMSRHVEAAVLSADSILLAAVQHVDNMSNATMKQYIALARRCGFAGMLGTRLSSIRGALHGVRTADLDPTDPLTRTWQVVVMSPTVSIALVATEIVEPTAQQPKDMDRVFRYRLLTDSSDVELAARALLRYF